MREHPQPRYVDFIGAPNIVRVPSQECGRAPRLPGGYAADGTIGTTKTGNGANAHEQAHRVEVQDQPPPWRQSVGAREEPAEPARIRAGPARPATQEAVRLRDPAFRQAEAEGVLRQYRRTPVPPP